MSIQTASPFRNASQGLARWTSVATLSPLEVSHQPSSPSVNWGSPASHTEGQEDLPPMGQLNAESQGLGICVSHTSQYQATEESPRGQGLSRGSNQHFPQVDWMGEMGTGSWAQWPDMRPLSWDELAAVSSPCPQASGCLSRRPFTVRKRRHREVEGWPSWGWGAPFPSPCPASLTCSGCSVL